MAREELLLGVVCVPILLYLLLPTIVVLPMAVTGTELLRFPPQGFSLRHFSEYFGDASWIDATITSIKVAFLAMAIGAAAGSSAALALHGKKFPGKSAVVGVILVPIVAPLIVLALADYEFLNRFQLVGTWVGIALAHSVLVTPYTFVTVQASLVGLNPALVRSAESLGAGAISLLRHVYWPAMKTGVLAGALFAFAVSFDEVVIALFLQGPQATTLPVKMFTSIQYDLTPKIAAAASLLVGLAALVFAVQAIVVLRRARRQRAMADPDAAAEVAYA